MFINTGTHRICWWILVNQWAWIKTYRVTTELLEPSKGKCSVRTHSPMKNVWPFHETKICSKKATTEREFSVESLKEFWIFFFSFRCLSPAPFPKTNDQSTPFVWLWDLASYFKGRWQNWAFQNNKTDKHLVLGENTQTDNYVSDILTRSTAMVVKPMGPERAGYVIR